MYFSLRFSLIVMACCLLGARSIAPKASPNRAGKDFALFFAVDSYDDPGWTDLRNPVRDAEAIAEELGTHFGFETEIHRNPSFNKIQDVIIQWQNKSFSNDAQLFVFFTGHGTVSNFDEEGYFVPRDADTKNKNHLSLRSLRQAIGRINCDHILIAVDACYSGTILKKGLPRRNGDSFEVNRLRTIKRELEYPSRLLLTSGGKERVQDGVKHSPFTEGLLNVFSSSIRTDGLITWEKLLSRILEEVKNPRPRYGTFEGHRDGGGFVFVRTEFSNEVTNPLPIKAFKGPGDILVPDMLEIPSGSFYIQKNQWDKGVNPNQKIIVEGFFLSKTEITNRQYCAFLNNKGNQQEGGSTWLNIDSKYALIEYRQGEYVPKKGFENHPVIYVSWYGAMAYCKWLSELKNESYRLPNVEEWEYAAGGGPESRTRWAGTNLERDLRSYSNYSGTGLADRYHKTAPVASFKPNRLGLYDMTGNVWEWCADTQDQNAYQYRVNSHLDQYDNNPNEGKNRVLRGGSWDSFVPDLSVSQTLSKGPAYRNYNYGFRIAKS